MCGILSIIASVCVVISCCMMLYYIIFFYVGYMWMCVCQLFMLSLFNFIYFILFKFINLFQCMFFILWVLVCIRVSNLHINFSCIFIYLMGSGVFKGFKFIYLF